MAIGREALIKALVEEMPWYVSAAVRFQIAVADQLEMPLADVHAVGALVEFGAVGVRRLADLMGMTTGAVTRMADRRGRTVFPASSLDLSGVRSGTDGSRGGRAREHASDSGSTAAGLHRADAR